MIPTTLNSESVYLLPYPDHWGAPPVLTVSMQADALRSKGGIERRQAFASTILSDLALILRLTGAEAAQFRIGLQALGNARVLCPFWPCEQAAGAASAPAFTTGLWLLAQGDLSEWEVSETGVASTFTPGATAFRVPLMLGYFAKEPNPVADTSGMFTVKIAFRESGGIEYALTPTDTDGAAGATLPTGGTPKIFPIAANWADKPEAGGAEVEIGRSQIGYGREPASTFYPQASSRPLSLGITAESSAQAAALVSFFLKRQGLVESFWLPGALDECRLTAAISSEVLNVDDVDALGAIEWIALVKIDDDSVQIRKIVGRNVGAKTITLDSAPTSGAASAYRIVSAVLSRFKKPSLALAFTTPGLVDAAISFVEVPTEYEEQTDETVGTTHGALPRTAFLYRFSQSIGSSFEASAYARFSKTVVDPHPEYAFAIANLPLVFGFDVIPIGAGATPGTVRYSVTSFAYDSVQDLPYVMKINGATVGSTVDIAFGTSSDAHIELIYGIGNPFYQHEAFTAPDSLTGALPIEYGGLTSYDRTITIGGTEAFTPAKIEHGEINDTLDPERTSVSLTTRAFTGNPLLLFLPNQLEGKLLLEILKCAPDSSGAAATATTIFYGSVRRPQFTGPIIKAEVAHILSDLGRNVPRYINQPTCNYRLYGRSCGVIEPDFTETVEITDITGSTVEVDGVADRDAGYYAFGKLRLSDGADSQTRTVYDSTVATGGLVTLTLDSPFRSPVTVGDELMLTPGCDKRPETCVNTFDNYPRFGGAPHIPLGNPSLVKVVQNETGGGKK